MTVAKPEPSAACRLTSDESFEVRWAIRNEISHNDDTLRAYAFDVHMQSVVTGALHTRSVLLVAQQKLLQAQVTR